MLLDTKTCIGCLACTIACKVEHNNPPGVWSAPVIQRETGEFPDVSRFYLPLMCMHCEDAPCVKACPAGAIALRDDGIVHVDGDRCCGSGACVVACPHDAIQLPHRRTFYFGAPTPYETAKGEYFPEGTAQKCDLCADRVDDGKEPACVEACPTDSRIFGDLDDAESEISQRLRGQETAPLLSGEFSRPKVTYTVDGVEDAGATAADVVLPYEVQSQWDKVHAAEFLFLGAGAGLSIVWPLLGDLRPGVELVARLASIILVALGGLLVLLELGRPLRGYQAVRNIGQSWISRGAIANFVVIGLALVLAIWPVQPDSPGRLAVSLLTVLAALVVATYPALAMSSYEGVAPWRTWLLPGSFFIDALAMGIGVTALIYVVVPLAGGGAGLGPALGAGLLAGAAARGVMLGAYALRLRGGTPALVAARKSLDSGAARPVWRYGVLAAGVLGAGLFALGGLVLTGGALAVALLLSGALTVVGSYCAKLTMLRTGAKPIAAEPDLVKEGAYAEGHAPLHRSA